jgi:hypothetical protein
MSGRAVGSVWCQCVLGQKVVEMCGVWDVKLCKYLQSFTINLFALACHFNINKLVTAKLGSQEIAVGVAIGCGLDSKEVRVRVPVGVRFFSTSPRSVVGPTRPPIECVPGALSSRVKQLGREADHSPPTSAEVRNVCIYTFTPPCVFKA